MRIRLVTAGAGAAWEAALVQACQAGTVPAEILHRCYDLGDLLAVAAAGQAEAAVVAASTRWLDHDALARLAAAGLTVVGVAPAGAINSNIVDMSRWLIALMNDGQLDGKQVLKAVIVPGRLVSLVVR